MSWVRSNGDTHRFLHVSSRSTCTHLRVRSCPGHGSAQRGPQCTTGGAQCPRASSCSSGNPSTDVSHACILRCPVLAVALEPADWLLHRQRDHVHVLGTSINCWCQNSHSLWTCNNPLVLMPTAQATENRAPTEPAAPTHQPLSAFVSPDPVRMDTTACL